MKVAFFGTPTFAIPSLEALVGSKHKIACIVTQPDKPIGRGGKVAFSPVKEFGLAHNIPVLQPEKISRELHLLDPYKPDIIITCAFGQILRANVLDYPRYGVINVHGSLLPKYRGASPIQWAVANGDTHTGVTIMRTDIGMDTGDMILSEPLEIGKEETSGELFPRIATLGAKLLLKALDQIERGSATYTPQNNSEATHAPMLKKEHGLIDWSRTTQDILNHIRGMNPWPGAYFILDNEIIKVHKARPTTEDARGRLAVKCADGYIELTEVQAPGARRISGRDLMNGRRLNANLNLN